MTTILMGFFGIEPEGSRDYYCIPAIFVGDLLDRVIGSGYRKNSCLIEISLPLLRSFSFSSNSTMHAIDVFDDSIKFRRKEKEK